MKRFLKNQIIEVTIVDITNLGFGVAKPDGAVLFVADTVPGDRVRAKIIKVTASYLVGKVEELLVASPDRVDDRCAGSACRSCAYTRISYAAECEKKHSDILEAYRKAGLPEIGVAPVTPSPVTCGYRNKAQYPIAKTKDGYAVGFYAPKSHRVTEAADCPAAPKVFSEILAHLRRYFADQDLSVYDEESGKGLLRHIYLRRGEVSGEILLTLVLNGESLPAEETLVSSLRAAFPDIVGILININRENTNVILGDRFRTLWGRDYIFDTLAGVELKISAPAFYQVNHATAELLYAKAKELVMPKMDDCILDLFCGAGSIGLSMAKEAGEIIGIEIVPEAIENAKENAARAGIANAHFYAGDATAAEKLLKIAERERKTKVIPDAVILDPPRGGCEAELIRYVASLAPSRIVYISCNPQTQARDLVLFRDLGYTAGTVYPFDMFPGTGHVETVILMLRVKE